MRVGLNALYLVPGHVGGVEAFARELVEALAVSSSAIEFVVFTSLDAKDVFTPIKGKCQVVVCPFRAQNRIVRYFWEQFILPWQVLLYRLDVLHSLSYVGPVICPVPTVLTIHDANSKRLTVTMGRLRRAALSLVSSIAAECADTVTTVSQFSREELVLWYKLRKDDIEVIHSGPGARLTQQLPITNPELERSISTGPYIVAMGGSWAHKNMPRLIQAYERIADQVQHRLIISGNIYGTPIETKLSDRVLFTGYLERSDLQEVLRRSDLFVMPSLYEGFGFPVLEAQMLGVAVACSNVASLPELMHDSAELFDPESVDDIAEVIKRCVLDRSLNQRMRQASEYNIRRFSWAATSLRYETLYMKLGQKTNGWVRHTLTCFTRIVEML